MQESCKLSETKVDKVLNKDIITTGDTDEKCKNDISEKCDKLNFQKKLSFDIKGAWISSIEALPNGNVVLADFNNSKLYVYNKNLERQKAVNLPGKPCCIATISADQMAVTLQDNQSIAIVNILSRKTLKMLKTADHCHGITYNGEHLVVNCLEKGIQFMNMNGNVQTTLSHVTGEAYLCSGRNQNVYCAVYWTHTIMCFNKQGEEIYSFTHLTMKCPRGIALHSTGTVFTLEFSKNKVHAVNSEGSKSRVLLSKKHGINNPLSVLFNEIDGCLYVSNNDGESVTIYET